MQALTRLNPTDPVRFDGMNTILGEIEGRDEDLLNKINDCLYSKKTLLLEQDLIAYIKSLTRPETFYAGRCTNAPEENSYFVVSVFIGGGGDKHIIASQFNAYGACKKWEGDIWNNEFKGWQQKATTESHELTFANGWLKNHLTFSTAVRVGNTVTMNFYIKDGVTTFYTTLTTLEKQYVKAGHIIYIPCFILDSRDMFLKNGLLRVLDSGIVDTAGTAISQGERIMVSTSYTI